jgi:sulfide dehydrogenase cytochrome subunit
LCCALALTALPFGAAVAQGPSGIALSWTCAGCHGTDGSSAGPSSPSIAAMDADVFVDAMQDYKADRRNSTIMNRIAKGYTDQQITAMAEFFARQPLRARPQEHDAAKASLGSELHQKYCEKCHEDGGRPGDSGILAGQWLPYLEFAMADFLAGRREWPRKMKKKVDDAIEYKGADAIPALLHYYASQH